MPHAMLREVASFFTCSSRCGDCLMADVHLDMVAKALAMFGCFG